MSKKFREKLKWLDPFHYVDTFILPIINPSDNKVINWIVYVVSAFVFAFIIFNFLGFLLGTSSPMVIVVSGSMEPTYYRGDVIVLTGVDAEAIEAPAVELDNDSLRFTPLVQFAELFYQSDDDSNTPQVKTIFFKTGQRIPIKKTGTVVVYFSRFRQQPIIHRVVAKLHAKDGWYVLTKGDSIYNNTLDQDCGLVLNGFPQRNCITLYPVPVEELEGKAVFKIPFIGYVKLLIFDDLPKIVFGG